MAVNTYEEVQFSGGKVVVSSSTALLKAPDGSLHKVPVVNCNALKYLQEYGDEEDVGDGNGFWYITTE